MLIQTLASFSSVMTKIGYVLVAILALMFMIVVHEFGHFIAGKKLGFQVNEFSIGFGPVIFKRKMKDGTQFSIRPIPLGGFCAFEGEDDDNDNPRAFNNMPPWKRIIVLFMGAFFNFLSAMIIITIFFCAYGESVSVVGRLYEGSVNQGVIQEGDIILQVDGKVKHILMNDDFSNMLSNTGDTCKLKIMRDGKTIDVTIKKGQYKYFSPYVDKDFYQLLYIDNNTYKAFDPTGWQLIKVDGKTKKVDTPLHTLKSGTELVYKKGDTEKKVFITVVKANNRLSYLNTEFVAPLSTVEFNTQKAQLLANGGYLMFEQIIDGFEYSVPIVYDENTIFDNNGNTFGFNFDTNIKNQTQLVAGQDGNERANFGFTRRLSTEKLGFFKALGRSFTYSFFIVFKVLALLGALLTGKIGLESAGGPITVISTVSTGIQQAGFSYLMYITCILSANVAVMNLLPLPALDGSKIVFTIVEWIRGKPLNRKVEAVIHTVGLILLFGFTIFVDIFHMVS